MGGDALAVLEDLDGGCGVAGFQLLAGELIRNAVIMPVDLDVVVDVGADRFPFRHDVAFGRQRLEGGTVDVGEQRGPRAFAFAKAPVVQTFEQCLDGFVEIGERKNFRCRSAARIQRSTMPTAFSTLALSRGL